MATERPTPGGPYLPAELTVTDWHEPLARVQRIALLAGIGGLVLCIGGLLLDAQRVYAAYLVAFLFWLGISLGSLAWVMIYHLTGGNWGLVIRRLLEASGRLTLLAVLFFLPLLPGLDDLYVWMRPAAVQADALLQHKQPYLNLPFFLARAVFYFIVWALLAWQLNRWSRQQDRSQEPTLVDRLRRLSGPGLAVYGLTITFAGVDWVMSLEPDWFSSIFGVLVAAGEALSALALTTMVLAWLAAYPPLSTVVTRQHFGDLGNLMLAAVLFWAYIAFAQFLIIWSGNLPEEVTWYLHRLEGSWQAWALFVLLFGFALPFAALLSGRLKRRARLLTIIAATLLVAQWAHLHWLVVPVVQPGGLSLHWLDLAAWIAVGGLWVAGFLWQLRRETLLSSYDWLQAQARGEHPGAHIEGTADA
jgi:hypothetical protein